MGKGKMYQVATLQSLMTGYTRAVITVDELLQHGDTGLGTFEDVNGEMIVTGGHCYKAMEDGSVIEASPDEGVPFASVASLDYEKYTAENTTASETEEPTETEEPAETEEPTETEEPAEKIEPTKTDVEIRSTSTSRTFDLGRMPDIDSLKNELDLKVEEWFGLNSMHVVRIDGDFDEISARSESPLRTQHISLKKILSGTQKEFHFDNASGTIVCIYYPDYMKGINAPGWHLHFLSADRTMGGHVFDLVMTRGTAVMEKISEIEIQLPKSPAFDTYSLADDAGADIKAVEQGKK